MSNIPPGLPISCDLATYIANQAIDLYRECLTLYDHDEQRAQAEAARTVGDGASVALDDPRPDSGWYDPTTGLISGPLPYP
jgi:hypothetical protein